jgi:hypothetical protein
VAGNIVPRQDSGSDEIMIGVGRVCIVSMELPQHVVFYSLECTLRPIFTVFFLGCVVAVEALESSV